MKRTWQPKNASWPSKGVPPSVMGLVPVSGLSWSASGYGQQGKEGLHVLEELDTEFSGKIFIYLYNYTL